MPDPSSVAGEPVCSECGYKLTGLTESSKCPECGRPLVEVLSRGGVWGRRYQSKTTLFGRPLVAVAIGPAPAEKIGHARGIIALGDKATGWIAVGGQARGGVAIGGMAIGLFAIGGLSIGLVTAIGGFAIGALAWGGGAIGLLASGGMAIGVVASGGLALGWCAVGGGPIGVHTAGPGTSDQAALDMMQRYWWFFGGPKFGLMTMLGPLLAIGLIDLAAAAVVGILAAAAHLRGSRGGEGNPYEPGD
ncbi:MAG: hypothetical protein ACYTGG_09145 [Planctomycetota bacterium]|jgi:hypothetical protein